MKVFTVTLASNDPPVTISRGINIQSDFAKVDLQLLTEHMGELLDQFLTEVSASRTVYSYRSSSENPAAAEAINISQE